MTIPKLSNMGVVLRRGILTTTLAAVMDELPADFRVAIDAVGASRALSALETAAANIPEAVRTQALTHGTVPNAYADVFRALNSSIISLVNRARGMATVVIALSRDPAATSSINAGLTFARLERVGAIAASQGANVAIAALYNHTEI